MNHISQVHTYPSRNVLGVYFNLKTVYGSAKKVAGCIVRTIRCVLDAIFTPLPGEQHLEEAKLRAVLLRAQF